MDDDPFDPVPRFSDYVHTEEDFEVWENDPVRILLEVLYGLRLSERNLFEAMKEINALRKMRTENPDDFRLLGRVTIYALRADRVPVEDYLERYKRRVNSDLYHHWHSFLRVLSNRAAAAKYWHRDPRLARAHLLYAKDLERGEPFQGFLVREKSGDPLQNIVFRRSISNF